MRVKYSYLSQQFGNCEELWQELKKFVKTGDFTLGKPLQKFENDFAKLIGTKFAIGVNSGTDAIKLSLKGIEIKSGDEIITAANTFVATVGAITELGCKPVFVDCDNTFCMNTNLIEKKITKKTKAIVPVHFTGYMVNMPEINKDIKKI
jgi:aminotransferase EvaB